jgi:hypothetical protein
MLKDIYIFMLINLLARSDKEDGLKIKNFLKKKERKKK